MPTVNEALGGWIEKAINNPKTTIGGLLTIILTVVPLLLSGNIIHGKTAAIAASILGLAKLYISGQEQDADKALAKVPGIPEPQSVPAHPVPDDPTNKPV